MVGAALGVLAQHLVQRYGPLGVLLGMTAESAGVPLPSEVIMPLGGLASPNPAALATVVALGTAGNLAGSWIAYGIGSAIGAGWRGGRLVPRAHWEAAHAWFARRGAAAVLLGRVLPGIRTYISFPAGAAGMPPGRFTAYTALGSAVWSAALAVLGYSLRTQWRTLEPWVHRYAAIAVAAALLAVAAAWWRGRRRARRTGAA